jgi:hypothetical protein
MPHRPKKVKKTENAKTSGSRPDEHADRRRVDAAARSALDRFQNRKSEKR